MTTELMQATKNLNLAFEVCLTYYDEVTEGKFRINDDYVQAQQTLQSSLEEFKAALYSVLKPIGDWNEQNTVLEEIKCFINARMFTDEFSYENCDAAIKGAPKSETGYYVINMIKVFRPACGWFSDDYYKLSWYCYNYEKDVLKINHKKINQQKQAVTTTENLTIDDVGTSIGRDATRFLFEFLNRKRVINVKDATTLSDLIGSVTGYSSGQIRKNFHSALTESSKQKLKSLLESIGTEIDKS